MSEETFTYKAENGNTCEIVDTFAEMFSMSKILGTFFFSSYKLPRIWVTA